MNWNSNRPFISVPWVWITSMQTIGSGEIAEGDEFTLSPNYRYQGKVLYAGLQKISDF